MVSRRTQREGNVGRMETVTELDDLGSDGVQGLFGMGVLHYTFRIRCQLFSGYSVTSKWLTSRENGFPGRGDEEGISMIRNVELRREDAMSVGVRRGQERVTKMSHDKQDDLEQFEWFGKFGIQLQNRGTSAPGYS